MGNIIKIHSSGMAQYTPKTVVNTGSGSGWSGGFSWAADKDYDYGYAIFSCYKGGTTNCSANNGATVIATGNMHTSHASGGTGNRTQGWFISNIKKGTTISWGWQADWQSSQAILVMFDKK